MDYTDDGDEVWEEPGCATVISERYGLVRSPRGTIYSMHPAKDAEEAAQQQLNYEAWLAEICPGMGDPSDDDPAVQRFADPVAQCGFFVPPATSS